MEDRRIQGQIIYWSHHHSCELVLEDKDYCSSKGSFVIIGHSCEMGIG